jgi:hypothetical protein
MISDADRQIVIGALDSLGVALVEHDHNWTVGERAIYEEAIKIVHTNAIQPPDSVGDV